MVLAAIYVVCSLTIGNPQHEAFGVTRRWMQVVDDEESYVRASLDASKGYIGRKSSWVRTLHQQQQQQQQQPEEDRQLQTKKKKESLRGFLQTKSSLRKKNVQQHQQDTKTTTNVVTMEASADLVLRKEPTTEGNTRRRNTKGTTVSNNNKKKKDLKTPPPRHFVTSEASAAPQAHPQIAFGTLAKRVATIHRGQRLQWEASQNNNHDNNNNNNNDDNQHPHHHHHQLSVHIQNRLRVVDNPVFVLSLPGSASLTTSRYFRCGLESSANIKEVAFYWTHRDDDTADMEQVQDSVDEPVPGYSHNPVSDKKKTSGSRRVIIPIGQCLQENTLAQRPPLKGCGQAHVWTSMGYVSPSQQQCFFPSWNTTALSIVDDDDNDNGNSNQHQHSSSSALEGLAREYPNATFVLVTQSPDQWYEASTSKFRDHVASYCSGDHIPSTSDATREAWMTFYEWHQQSVRHFVQAHPSLNYVEVALEAPETSTTLYKHFGLSKLCWQPPDHKPFNELDTPQLPATENTLPYPIFVASLPKSGTTSTQRFFQCGLGYYEAGHHWMHNQTSDKPMKIGKCMEGNLQHNRSLFEGCGDFTVWADTGYLDEPITKMNIHKRDINVPLGCFFPTMHGGLEAFYESNPNGTIMNVLRDPKQWYTSAMNWRKLPERMSKQCKGFPAPGSSPEAWRDFYEWHTQHVRDFATAHPSLTYVEVSLEADNTGKLLQDKTGIPEKCWGDCNPDRSKGMCGVLKHMKGYGDIKKRGHHNTKA